MADQYTPLEEKIDKLYEEGLYQLARPGVVQSWDDYLQRRGFLAGLQEAGMMIKTIRRPVEDTGGEIQSILPTEE